MRKIGMPENSIGAMVLLTVFRGYGLVGSTTCTCTTSEGRALLK